MYAMASQLLTAVNSLKVWAPSYYINYVLAGTRNVRIIYM